MGGIRENQTITRVANTASVWADIRRTDTNGTTPDAHSDLTLYAKKMLLWRGLQ